MRQRMSRSARTQTQNLVRDRVQQRTQEQGHTLTDTSAQDRTQDGDPIRAGGRKQSRIQAISGPAFPQSEQAEKNAGLPPELAAAAPAPVPEPAPELSPAFVLQQAARGWIGSTCAVFKAGLRWILSLQKPRSNGKRLRVLETVSLGEKRYVAVLNVDGTQFLVGGGGNNVSLLASLDSGSQSRFALALQQSERDLELES